MKVVASLADSASLKALEFKRSVDTSSQQTESLTINEIIAGPPASPKKQHAITHFARLKDGKMVVARKSGEILLNEEVLARASSELAGLAVADHDIIFAFGSDGASFAIDGSRKVHNFSLREGLTSVVQNPNNVLEFASAGLEQLPDVFTLNVKASSTQVDFKWEATQPPNDRLDLPERNLVNALAFVHPQRLIAVTSSGRIRMYDLNSENRQPQEIVQAGKDPIKSIAADPEHPGTFIIGDSRTTVSRWSSMPFRLLGHYKGVSGSTRALSVRGPYLAVGGLDRYVRVFDVVKRQPAGKVYVGGQIWALALERHDLEEDEQDLDKFWGELSSQPKRRKVVSQEPSASKLEKLGNRADDSSVESSAESEEESESEVDPEGSAESASDSGDDFEGFDD